MSKHLVKHLVRHWRLAGLLPFCLLTAMPPAAQAAQTADQIVGRSVSLSDDAAALELELAGGRSLRVRLADGRALIDGREVGSYAPGGPLESAWRSFLRDLAEDDLASAWSEMAGRDLTGAEAETGEAIRTALAPLMEAGAAVPTELETVAESPNAAAPDAPAAVPQRRADQIAGRDVVVGGLVVELSRVDDLARRLERIGLAPELSRLLNGDTEGPVRIVIDAEEYRLPEGVVLDEMLVLVQTDGVLAGTVAGNVVVAEGSLRIAPGARVEGDVVAVNASVTNEGTVVGTLREAASVTPVVIPTPVQRVRVESRGPSFLDRAFDGLGSLTKTIAMYLLFAFLGALIVYLFRGHLENVSDTVSYSFGRSFLTGLAAEVLFFPILLVMVVLILPIIAIPFYVIGFGLAALLGYIAVAHAAGENLTQHRFPSWPARLRRSNSYYYVLNGLGVLLALFAGAAVTEMAYPLLGWAHGLLIASAWILTWVASTAGLGAALLSRAGTQRTYARPTQIPGLAMDTLAEEWEPLERRAGARRRREPGAEG